jgi:hypothetical protein
MLAGLISRHRLALIELRWAAQALGQYIRRFPAIGGLPEARQSRRKQSGVGPSRVEVMEADELDLAVRG